MAAKDAGALTRLLVLGTLAAHGASHGHQIRRLIERVDLELWSEVRVGAIYHALRRLAEDELIAALRTERDGKRPPRTVYALTPQGEVELTSLQDKLLHQVSLGSDPFDLALWVAATGNVPGDQLAEAVGERIASLERTRAQLNGERTRLGKSGHLPAVGDALMRHGEIRIDAELRWHRELLERLPELANTAQARGG